MPFAYYPVARCLLPRALVGRDRIGGLKTMNHLALADIVARALNEDLQQGDITSESIFQELLPARGLFLAKSAGVIAGIPVVEEVFRQLDPKACCKWLITDGTPVSPGTTVGEVNADIRTVLSGERVALNFLQRLSGIATQTARLVRLTAGYSVRIVDTRKTTPGLRMLEKYAVRQGGGFNHRYSLADAVLIKDNHIAAAGSINAAVERARKNIPHTTSIEVEVENETQVREALAAKVECILLDNMTPAEMTAMVRLIRSQSGTRHIFIEASGNIGESNIAEVAATGVDIISSGALTHSVKALDVSLEIASQS